MQNEIKYIDLFGGVGGFRLGIERAFNNESKRQESENVKDKSNTCSNPIQATTLNCVFYSDIDKYAVQTYNKNFGENHEATDIRTIEADSIPDFDMLCGGFPDNWTEGVSDTQRYKQMGNAVTVNVIQAIAEKLLK